MADAHPLPAADGLAIAGPAELPALVELLTLLFAQEADFTPDPERQMRGLRLLLAQPDIGQILVWRQAGVVCGMVSLLYTISTALGGRVAWLEDMVLHPLARGQGVGGQLLDAALAHARAQGCLRVTLLTDGDNLPAQRFYARHGFAPSAMQPWRQGFADTR